MTAKPGPGHFQWNGGGWAGAQLGGTLWLLAGPVWLARQAPGVAAAWLGLFAAANLIGLALWRGRRRIEPYPAFQALLLTCGIAAVAAVLSLWGLRPDLAGREFARPRDLAFLLIFPAMMLAFHLMEASALAQARRDRPPAG